MKTRYAAEQHFEDFWKIIQTHVLHRFKHNKLSYADYQKMGKIERAKKFSLPKGLLKKIGRFVDETGRDNNHAMQFIRQLEEQGKVIYHAKVTRFYTTSGKRFDLPPWIEITSSQLQILLVLDREGKFELTPRQKKLIVRYFPKKKKPTDKPKEITQQPKHTEENKMNSQVYAANVPDEEIDMGEPKTKDAPKNEVHQINVLDLQDLVDRKIILFGEAQSINNLMHCDVHLKRPKDGLINQEIADMPYNDKIERETILRTSYDIIIKAYHKSQRTDDVKNKIKGLRDAHENMRQYLA